MWSLPQFFTLCECVITKSSWKMWLITFWYNQTNILRPSYHCILIFPFSLLLNWMYVCSNVASNVKSRRDWSLWNIYGLDVCLRSPEPQLMSCLKICKAREPTFAGSMRFGCFCIISLTIRQPQLCPWVSKDWNDVRKQCFCKPSLVLCIIGHGVKAKWQLLLEIWLF